jgi:hypothetical protein
MARKTKRYRVWVKDPLLNTWRAIATELTKVDADRMVGQVFWDARKEEVEDDDAE